MPIFYVSYCLLLKKQPEKKKFSFELDYKGRVKKIYLNGGGENIIIYIFLNFKGLINVIRGWGGVCKNMIIF